MYAIVHKQFNSKTFSKQFNPLWERQNHRWLADLAAPVGSQEIVDHTHKWWQLIGQHLPVCRLGPQVSAGWVPSWQYYLLTGLKVEFNEFSSCLFIACNIESEGKSMRFPCLYTIERAPKVTWRIPLTNWEKHL